LSHADDTAVLRSPSCLQGIASTEYRQLAQQHLRAFTPYSATGTLSISVAAGRVSYAYGLKGPSVPVETACSSSLVSLHTAANSIVLGQCPAAINAGLNMLLVPGTTAMFQKAGMLALDGRCKTLSAAADGYARADACGAMLVLPAAAAPGCTALAVVAGSAVNQDGRSSTLTAPNGPAQQEVIRAALRSGGLAAASVAGLQLHGTGTGLGDPIEVGAAAASLVEGRPAAAGPVALMASKSWTGHAEAGAGVVGLVHAQAALSQAAALPVLHLAELNPYVTGAMDPASVAAWSAARQAAPLPRREQLAAIGTSAFAFQGTNAHVIMQPGGDAIALPAAPAVLWARQRLWVAVAPHAGLHRVSAAGGAALMQCSLASAPLAYLWDHRVSGKVLFPGAAFFELAAAAAKLLSTAQGGSLALSGLAVPEPLALPDRGLHQLTAIALEVSVDCASGAISIASGPRSAHLKGSVAALAAASPLPGSSGAAKSPAWRTALLTLRHGENTAAAARVGDICNAAQAARDVFLSPAVLDCCLQLGAVPARPGGDVALKVPAGVAGIMVPGAPEALTFQATALERANTAAGSLLDYGLAAAGAAAACSVAGLQAKPLGGRPVSEVKAAAAAPETDIQLAYNTSWLADQPADVAAAISAGSFAAALDAAAPAASLCCGAVGMLQVLASAAANPTGLQLQTAEAHTLALAAAPTAGQPAAGLLWGALRSAAQEAPALRAAAEDIEPLAAGGHASGAILRTLAAAPAASDAHGRAVRGGLLLHAALQPDLLQRSTVAAAPAARSPSAGRAVITGGMGSIGSLVALWAVDTQRLAGLTLVGRSGRAAGAAPALAALLAASEIPVTLVLGDAACQEDSDALFGASSGAAPATLVIHSGGVLADSTLANQRPGGVRGVFAPKVAATLAARAATSLQPVASEVLFSSVAALLGSPGQTNYSAANAALDALAARAQAGGGASTSVQWGAWAGAGMAAGDRSTALRVERLGMGMVQPAPGLALLQRVLAGAAGAPVLAAVPFLWHRFIQRLGSAVPPMFQEFAVAATAVSTSPSGPAAGKVMAAQALLARRQPGGPRGGRDAGRAAAAPASEELKQQVLVEVQAVARSILGRCVLVY
jgi:3-oxoacyl-(acyl-carrier-protein) synthase